MKSAYKGGEYELYILNFKYTKCVPVIKCRFSTIKMFIHKDKPLYMNHFILEGVLTYNANDTHTMK